MIEFEMVICPKNGLPHEAYSSELKEGESDNKFLCIGPTIRPREEAMSAEDYEARRRKGYFLKGYTGLKEFTQFYVGFSRCVNQTDVPDSIGQKKNLSLFFK